jgi:uncharacterized protein (TIGR02757 family)
VHLDPKVFLDARIPFGANLAPILPAMAKQMKKELKRNGNHKNQPRVSEEIRMFLLEKADEFERPNFIPDDPISVPHRFDHPRDIELAGFIAASLAWGQRKTILNNAQRLIERMDSAPAEFLHSATSADIARAAEGFVHRTFQPRDALVFLHALQVLLQQFESLEQAFVPAVASVPTATVESHLIAFHERFFEAAASRGFMPDRTRKHVASPARGSATKRLNMFLRWMVRSPHRGVDFGIWKEIHPHQLMIPLDVHTGNVGRKLGLLNRGASDWKAVVEFMEALREVDAQDPVRLDFALFGLGAVEGF